MPAGGFLCEEMGLGKTIEVRQRQGLPRTRARAHVRGPAARQRLLWAWRYGELWGLRNAREDACQGVTGSGSYELGGRRVRTLRACRHRHTHARTHARIHTHTHTIYTHTFTYSISLSPSFKPTHSHTHAHA
jgi:hypothetical protein